MYEACSHLGYKAQLNVVCMWHAYLPSISVPLPLSTLFLFIQKCSQKPVSFSDKTKEFLLQLSNAGSEKLWIPSLNQNSLFSIAQKDGYSL